ncbi:MAG TPA: adenine deaminase [Clostridia bacterium]
MKKLIDAATKRIKPDKVLKGGFVVNVFSGKIVKADVAILDGKIVGVGEYDGIENIDVNGKYVIPGLIDTHLHIESTMLTPAEFCKAVIPYGTTTIIADPHEIANVLGFDGVKYMIEQTKGLPINAHFMLPSCVPATFFENAGAVIDSKQINEHINDPDIFGLAEFMNFVGVVMGDEECLAKIQAAHDAGKIVDGHAPEIQGESLNAYAGAGIKTEHECTTVEDMLRKIDSGMYIQLRQGSATRNVATLVKGVTPQNMRRCVFCTDDRHIDSLLYEGHLNYNLKIAVENGLDPVSAVIMATLNAAECYGLKGYGAIAPGYAADIVIMNDLKDFAADMVFFKGELVARQGKPLFEAKAKPDDRVLNTVRVKEVTPADFEIYSNSDKVHAIGLIPANVVTKKEVVQVKRNPDNSVIIKDTDLLKLAVVERHKNTGNIGKGLIKNYGLKNGAIAQTIAHDSHNIIVLGDNNEDMALAVNSLRELGGGLIIVSQGKVLGSLKLEVAGLMTAQPIEKVNEEFQKMIKLAHSLGVSKEVEPFMTLSFLALPVIPSLKLTDKGLFDVDKFAFIPLEAE